MFRESGDGRPADQDHPALYSVTKLFIPCINVCFVLLSDNAHKTDENIDVMRKNDLDKCSEFIGAHLEYALPINLDGGADNGYPT